MTALGRDAQALDAARRELVLYGRRLVTDGLAFGSAGNLSVRVGDVVVITPSSKPYETIEHDDLCVVAADGTKLDGNGSISSEWPMHWEVYSTTDAAAVVHTHSPEVIALSATCDELPAIHYAIARVGGPVRVASYTRFGSDGLARAAAAAMEGRSAAILQNHGAITYGPTLAEAYDRAALLEWLAGIYRRARHYGSPRLLTTAELDEVVAEVRRRRYGDATAAVGADGR
ncbi:MAG TPA: class II aldolase/adducin family protein [Acidimicrobiales bacterium]|nr:class II aldolase/adducin family protein [Acidimicrobiales bacterium]